MLISTSMTCVTLYFYHQLRMSCNNFSRFIKICKILWFNYIFIIIKLYIGNPATSNAITLNVNSNLPVSVSVSASSNPVCSGTTVTYNATPVNGGLTPAYLWKVNGIISGTSSPTFIYVPNNNDIVTCILTSSEACALGSPATSNQVIMTCLLYTSPSPRD